MKETRHLMGMHVTVEVADPGVGPDVIDEFYQYFQYVDETFSTYKETSEISRMNAGLLSKSGYSPDMKAVLLLCELTRNDANGYFDIRQNGKLDPSGLVKGWAIWQAARLLRRNGVDNFYVDAGGDIQVSGVNDTGEPWRVGIRNPFDENQIVKVVELTHEGIATSGTACRGQHIYNPHRPGETITDVVSLSVIGPNVYEADRFATSAFAMGSAGISFIEGMPGFEGYMIDGRGIATFTSGFSRYVLQARRGTDPSLSNRVPGVRTCPGSG